MTPPWLPILEWRALSSRARSAALRRPTQQLQAQVLESARQIITAVRTQGDRALKHLTLELDRVALDQFAVSSSEFAAAEAALDPQQKLALQRAIDNVRCFHAAQILAPLRIETAPGVVCERRVVPVRAVGLYVPAGSAPLPSTAIMLAVPAELVGCPTRVLCTPPRPDGRVDSAVLFVARQCGVEQVFKLGGAQAIAAMAYGTETVPRVDKIYGPGNAWVTAAKQCVANDPEGAACDLPAGPSEVLVIADDQAQPEFIAADLLAQAEHSPDAQVLLVTTSRRIAEETRQQIDSQLSQLTRRTIAARSLESARLLLVEDLETALAISNEYAPEHLILEVSAPRTLLGRVTSAGSVFLGSWSPESIGDYCSGTNHVLPTNGSARTWSGLSLLDFTKRITVQELTPAGLLGLGPTARTLAQLEGLDAHANAVTVRLTALARQSAS